MKKFKDWLEHRQKERDWKPPYGPKDAEYQGYVKQMGRSVPPANLARCRSCGHEYEIENPSDFMAGKERCPQCGGPADRSVKNEHMRTHQERDPFARQTVVGRPVDAHGKSCDWCGSEGRNGKLYQYTVENDGGRDSQVKGLFCCKDCMEQYHGD